MDVTFKNKHLQELYETGKNRKYRLEERLIDKFIERVNQIADATSIHDLMAIKSLHFEKLQGHLNRFSVRAQGQYRVEFDIDFTDAAKTTGNITIFEYSNHYGD